ncbi:hypothetical protein CF328_g7752 [Tilletia controversa]|nr:hypothetical protein CF328_g7752 [Tilletia controversa]
MHRPPQNWSEAKGVSIIHIVRSARPLPSGDWIITFGTAKWARLVSRYKDSWLDQLHPGFFIKDGEFEVAVDLVPLTFNLEEYSHYKDLVQNNPVVKDSTLIDWIGGARGLEEAKAKKSGTALSSSASSPSSARVHNDAPNAGRPTPPHLAAARSKSLRSDALVRWNAPTSHSAAQTAKATTRHQATARECPSRAKAFKLAQNWAFNSGELFTTEHEWDTVASRLLVDPSSVASKYSREEASEEAERNKELVEEHAEEVHAARYRNQGSVPSVSTYLLQSSSSPVKPPESPPPPPSHAQTIKSIQLNCARRSTTMHSLINSAPEQDFDLVFVQEPHLIKHTGAPSSFPGWRPFFPAFDNLEAVDPELSSRAITYAFLSRFPGSTIETIPSNHRDIVAIAVRPINELPAIIFINIYNQKGSNTTKDHLSTIIRQSERKYDSPAIIVLGDFNLHHELWNPQDCETVDPGADYLLETLSTHGLELRSEPGIPTYEHWSGQTSSTTIDLVFTNAIGRDLITVQLQL